jgi:hypothetical protein
MRDSALKNDDQRRRNGEIRGAQVERGSVMPPASSRIQSARASSMSRSRA